MVTCRSPKPCDAGSNPASPAKPAGPILIRITAEHFCAGIDWPSRYAPILSYMKFFSLKSIENYCDRKGWKFEIVDGNYE